jgi:hypothetical protein
MHTNRVVHKGTVDIEFDLIFIFVDRQLVPAIGMSRVGMRVAQQYGP